MVVRGGRTEHNRMSMRLYTPGQMKRLFERAGLNVEALYGSQHGEPYTRSSKRLIVVGRKMESANISMHLTGASRPPGDGRPRCPVR
jgi:hypothetical protein